MKFNSQAILRNAGAFTAEALIIFFLFSTKKQELRFQQLCSLDAKIALKQNFTYIWTSPSVSRDRGFIVFLDRNERKKFLSKQGRREIICRF